MKSPGLTLVSYGGKSFRFDPGALCMELVTTGGPGEFARFEVLHEPADLVRWVERSRLPGGLEVTVTEGELAQTRALRDAVFLLAADRAHGRPLQARHLDVVNAGAAGAPLAARVEADGSRGWAPGATGARLLATVARDAVELFTGPYAERIRECGSHNCALLFVDTSRPGRRRWCAMEHCGNRQKARTHRARVAGEGAG
ncbi:ABATE domain-containing protein [Streptomyces phaeochromogenes]|uniref:ABATE domain-containing protein n=1 Tax=Streptomyces phaeochromogenes TaxID=1923 RepID=A0ABZ1HT10_STRPH|nr:ABATE domain-containing protein [Streptomyces phaeochromogenes]WRZ36307.1 ABATE domain-containing protein [Streptomyces phaeochromogenes]WSD21742.1 ABATE domain-containing protein [Streptomyces phaeochromogenes]WSJ11639.1 ABATE domain-containing protein [Streptomyces phaeochromogenes]WST00130.1 ABATE domain-containing protein [Streptomyces phaeochromogenes]WSW21369.1 ABATE domain-containing protein [Streptomyces phaeochromogenes]